MKSDKEKIIEQVKTAFREYLITGGAGVGIPKKAVDAYWEIFNKSLGWRLDNLYGEKQKKENKWQEVETPISR